MKQYPSRMGVGASSILLCLVCQSMQVWPKRQQQAEAFWRHCGWSGRFFHLLPLYLPTALFTKSFSSFCARSPFNRMPLKSG